MVIMIGSKVLEVLEIVPDFIGVRTIKAAETEESKKEGGEAKKEETPKEESKPKEEAKPKEEGEAAKTEGGEGKTEGKTEAEIKAEAAKKELENQELVRANHPKTNFSAAELLILQELATRREQLDQREKEISVKENSLVVIENNIHNKILNLQELQEKLKFVLSQYEVKEDEKIRSLVKVYESMKPADAAKIFEKLEMPTLLSVATHMKESKLAAILAKMDPTLAKELTMEIANFRKIQGID